MGRCIRSFDLSLRTSQPGVAAVSKTKTSVLCPQLVKQNKAAERPLRHTADLPSLTKNAKADIGRGKEWLELLVVFWPSREREFDKSLVERSGFNKTSRNSYQPALGIGRYLPLLAKGNETRTKSLEKQRLHQVQPHIPSHTAATGPTQVTQRPQTCFETTLGTVKLDNPPLRLLMRGTSIQRSAVCMRFKTSTSPINKYRLDR